MIGRLRRSILCLFVVALGVFVQPLHAQTPAGGVAVRTYTGFFDNTAVYFTAFETNSANFAAVNGLVYAPRLSQSFRNGLADMIFFSGGAPGQTVVLQSAPGRSDYSPLWRVLAAQWRGPGAAPVITSYAAAIQWWRLGRLAIQSTGIVFNGPVVWVNMSLNRLGGHRAPTISPNEFLGINPAARLVLLRAHYSYYAGVLVAFLSLEHAPGVISFAPGAIPVPKIGLNFLGHPAVANLYEVQGQQIPVIDSIPTRQAAVSGSSGYGIAGVAGKPDDKKDTGKDTGQTGQTGQAGQTGQEPVYTPSSGVPQPALYSPIWHVHRVVFRTGVAPRPLRAVQEIQQALNFGHVFLAGGAAQDVFNCPVVAIQTGSSGGGTPFPVTTDPGTGTTPIYSPPPPAGATPVTPTPAPGTPNTPY